MTPAALYVVHWPDHAVLKAGYSAARRWHAFERRGGSTLLLAFYEDPLIALEAEEAAHEALRERLDPAFISGDEARALLGRRGAGWMECYRVVDASRALGMLQSIAQVYAPMHRPGDAPMHCTSKPSTAMPRTYVRTLRTDASVQIDPSLNLSNARVRVQPEIAAQVGS